MEEGKHWGCPIFWSRPHNLISKRFIFLTQRNICTRIQYENLLLLSKGQRNGGNYNPLKIQDVKMLCENYCTLKGLTQENLLKVEWNFRSYSRWSDKFSEVYWSFPLHRNLPKRIPETLQIHLFLFKQASITKYAIILPQFANKVHHSSADNY